MVSVVPQNGRETIGHPRYTYTTKYEIRVISCRHALAPGSPTDPGIQRCNAILLRLNTPSVDPTASQIGSGVSPPPKTGLDLTPVKLWLERIVALGSSWACLCSPTRIPVAFSDGHSECPSFPRATVWRTGPDLVLVFEIGLAVALFSGPSLPLADATPCFRRPGKNLRTCQHCTCGNPEPLGGEPSTVNSSFLTVLASLSCGLTH